MRRRALTLGTLRRRDEGLDHGQGAGAVQLEHAAPARHAVQRRAVHGPVRRQRERCMRIGSVEVLEEVKGAEPTARVQLEERAQTADGRADEVSVAQLRDARLRVRSVPGAETVHDLERLRHRCGRCEQKPDCQGPAALVEFDSHTHL